MCYYVKETTPLDELAEQLSLNAPKGNHQMYFEPSLIINGFSHPWVPVELDLEPGQMKLAKWGLMIGANDSFKEQMANKMNTLNTTVEKHLIPGTVCNRYQNNHGVLMVDGFYEWQHRYTMQNGKRHVNKERHLITKKGGGCLRMACIHNQWYNPELKCEVSTISILTRKANALMEVIHNSKKRMPVILQGDEVSHWMSGDLEVSDLVEMGTYFEDLPLDANRR